MNEQSTQTEDPEFFGVDGIAAALLRKEQMALATLPELIWRAALTLQLPHFLVMDEVNAAAALLIQAERLCFLERDDTADKLGSTLNPILFTCRNSLRRGDEGVGLPTSGWLWSEALRQAYDYPKLIVSVECLPDQTALIVSAKPWHQYPDPDSESCRFELDLEVRSCGSNPISHALFAALAREGMREWANRPSRPTARVLRDPIPHTGNEREHAIRSLNFKGEGPDWSALLNTLAHVD